MEHSDIPHHHRPRGKEASPPDVRWLALTIKAGGVMDPADLPKLNARTGDWVIWIVSNASDHKLKLTLKDFHKKHDGGAATPIDWFVDGHVDIDAGRTGAIGGTVTYVPADDGMTFKYTVGVSGPGSHDYDPDLEVSPPN